MFPAIPRRLLLFCILLASFSPVPAAEPEGDPQWMQIVQQRIAASEYEITWQSQTVLADLEPAWHAPNRAHDLRTYFTPAGPRVVRRTSAEPTWQWALSLTAYGRRERLVPVAAARLHPDGNRIEYRRGPLVEWYINDPRGLEQGFTLDGPPESIEIVPSAADAPAGSRTAPAEGDPAYLVLTLGGSLSPKISPDGQAIDFVAPGGAKVLRYAHLLVTDADGRELPAWMEGFAEAGVRGLRIVFDDRDARYPLTVDPLATTAAWTAESNQANARLGISVATAGDVNGDGYSDVIVGAYLFDNGQTDEGRAYVYHGSASGLSATAAWTAESDQSSALFGWSVATAGDVNGDGYSDVIVGAYNYDAGQTNEGRAYVYHGSAAGLSAAADWTAEGDQSESRLGFAVATAGDVNGDGYSDVIVGADAYDSTLANEGRALVYHGSSSGLSTTADWTLDGGQVGVQLGKAVATAGDVNGDGYADVVLGIPLWDGGQVDEGQVRVFFGSSAGLSATADWTVGSEQAGAEFGDSVGTAGDVNGDGYADLAIGAQRYSNGQSEEGKAYVFHGGASGPSATADWSVESNQADAWMGDSVFTAGDVNGDGYADLIVGARRYDNGEANEGAAFVYHGSATGLATTANWSAESNQTGARFGVSVATAGDVDGDGYADVIVGSYLENNPDVDEGRAYVYHGSAAGLSTTADWSVDNEQLSSRMGYSVSGAGDINGDGYADVLVGAYLYDGGETDEGRAYAYYGSADGLSATENWTAESNQAGARFGISVSDAGDVNGDGYADVIIGADIHDGQQAHVGRAFVYLGSSSGLSATADWTADSDQSSSRFGFAVGSAGDVNGDGYADVVVGAYSYDNGEVNEGRAFVYYGSAAGPSPSADWVAESNVGSAQFGFSVATAGDVNGDGYDDLIVGAFSFSNGKTNQGRAYVYHGSPSGLETVTAWTRDGDTVDANFGRSVASAGDVNGDGYADVIVGAYTRDDGSGAKTGRATVYHGSSSGLEISTAWWYDGTAEGDSLGEWVDSAGDVNGDGYADVIVGAPGFDGDATNLGNAYVFLGSSAGLSTSEDWSKTGPGDGATFGSVAGAGDVNGDGFADVVIGAWGYSNPAGGTGSAYVFYGNEGGGLSPTPQQRRADDLAPIVSGGRSRESGAFRLAVTGRSPLGRSKVRLEWEVKDLGLNFDGQGTGRSALVDTGTTGADFNELISNLEPGARAWRMRLLYDRASSPFQVAGRWWSTPGNSARERDLTIASFIGGQVWEDRNGDGLIDAAEPKLGGIQVQLLDSSATVIDSQITVGDGTYRFEVEPGDSLRVRFVAPADWGFTLRDQGRDDMLDSDADTVTGETAPIASPYDTQDEQRWSAGLRQLGPCLRPDEPIYIYAMRLTTDGNDYPILDFEDPNQPGNVTGYNVYRSSDAGLPSDQWPQVASNVVDGDEATPNKQWTDTSGDVSPSGTWYYEVTAYNSPCDEEGPR
ncbi:MAG TPA: hypothetical protein ENK10_01815 [Acidobacteria bacterium]|nr:hypothetical protein [Acidobacteriota bacterium]